MHYRLAVSLILAAVCGVSFAESIEDKVKATDMTSADSVCELAQWCKDNNLPTKARSYFNQAIKLDPEHEGARTALGQVKVGSRWIGANMVPKSNAPVGGGAGVEAAPPGRQPSGTAPTAEQIEWDLTLPKDPQPASTWINQYINKLDSIGNDSNEMSIAVATMLQDAQIDFVIPRLCRKLLEPSFSDLYGTCELVNELLRADKGAKARIFLPFMVKASERITDPEDLSAFCYTVGQFKDKRVVPRLLQLLSHPNADVKDGAIGGLELVTLLPQASITAERIRQWWALNYNTSDQQIYLEQLRSPEPRVAFGAANALYEYRERSIVPVLAKLMAGENRIVSVDAAALLKRITGSDWSFNPEEPIEKRKKRAAEIETWWKAEQNRFIWIEDSQKAATATESAAASDPATEWIKQLGSATATESASAESNLTGAGTKAVGVLIEGLNDGNRLVRRKCLELLERITKQKFPFDPAADQAIRNEQILAWRKWAVDQKLIADEGAEEPAAP